MSNANYITAKTIINLLTEKEKIKLFKELMQGIGSRKKMRAERVENYKKYLSNK